MAARPARPVLRAVPLADMAAQPDMLAGWRQLAEAGCLPMQGPAFLLDVARCWLADADARALVVEAGGRLRALLPLVRERGWLARWRMIGPCEVYEPNDALYADAAAAAALAEGLARRRLALRLHRVPAGSALVPALRRALRGRGWLVARAAAPTPAIALHAGWADPASQLNPGRRSDLRRAARRAAACGVVSYEMLCPGPARFDALFDEAVAVEQSGWKRAAGSAMRCDPAKAAFFRGWMRQACDEGLGRFAFLRIDGRAVAMQMGAMWQGRYWLFKIGYDEAHCACSPGNLLMLHCLGEAARAGLSSFELLGGMERWIADLWTRAANPCLDIRIYPFAPAGLAALLADGAAWAGQKLRARATGPGPG